MRAEHRVAMQAAGTPAQDARTVREQLRRNVDQTRLEQEQLRDRIREAVEQSRAVSGAPGVQVVQGAQGGSGRGGDVQHVIVPPPPPSVRVEGNRVIVGEQGQGPVFTRVETVPARAEPPVTPEMIRDVSTAFFMMIAFIAVGIPLVRLLGRWLDRRNATPPAIPADVGQRLDRIEQAVEAVAIEIERISEGQRFTSRLISELRATPQLERVTEHRG